MTAFRPRVLGPGAVFIPEVAVWYTDHADLIAAVEVEPQPLWVKPRNRPPHGSARQIAALRDLPQPFLLHGIGAPLGGLSDGAGEQLPELKLWADMLGVDWVSEHMSLLHLGEDAHNCGFLMPPLQSEEYVSIAARNIRRRAAALSCPVAFETGVNYFAPRAGELDDGVFWAKIAEEADTGILLDLTNIWVNAMNGRAPVEQVLRDLPLDRVWEVHLAGAERRLGCWLDAHCGEINPDILAIAREVMPNLPNAAAITFEVAPDRIAAFGELAFLRQMEEVSGLWELRRDEGRQPPSSRDVPERCALKISTAADWETALARRLLDFDPPDPAIFRPEDSATLDIYCQLIAAFRRGVVADLLENSARLLIIALGESGAESVLDRYCAQTPPAFFASEEARQFAEWMRAHPVAVPGLVDILAFEIAIVESIAESESATVAMSLDIEGLITAIGEGRVPDDEHLARRYDLKIELGASPRVIECEPA